MCSHVSHFWLSSRALLSLYACVAIIWYCMLCSEPLSFGIDAFDPFLHGLGVTIARCEKSKRFTVAIICIARLPFLPFLPVLQECNISTLKYCNTAWLPYWVLVANSWSNGQLCRQFCQFCQSYQTLAQLIRLVSPLLFIYFLCANILRFPLIKNNCLNLVWNKLFIMFVRLKTFVIRTRLLCWQ